MPFHVVELTERALAQVHVPMRDARILVLGVAFKRDIDDARNSPAERVIELLLKRGATVRYHDPYVPCFRVGGDAFVRQPIELYSQPLTESLVRESDCVVIVTGHRVVDYAFVVRNARAVVDCMNATEGVAGDKRHVIRLGATPL